MEAFDEALAGKAAATARRATRTAVGAAGEANPYRGLEAFQRADAHQFFGRDRLVDELVEVLRRPGSAGRLVTVVGPSGSGKSSVVRAGLLPALERGVVPGSGDWFVTTWFLATMERFAVGT